MPGAVPGAQGTKLLVLKPRFESGPSDTSVREAHTTADCVWDAEWQHTVFSTPASELGDSSFSGVAGPLGSIGLCLVLSPKSFGLASDGPWNFFHCCGFSVFLW